MILGNGMIDEGEEANISCGIPELGGYFFFVGVGEVDYWNFDGSIIISIIDRSTVCRRAFSFDGRVRTF